MIDLASCLNSTSGFAFGAMALVPPLALAAWWNYLRRKRIETKTGMAVLKARALEHALDTAPDGWYAWFRGTRSSDERIPFFGSFSGNGEYGVCSRRLAVHLALFSGRASSFDDILAAFPENEAKTLETLTTQLREKGDGFEVILTHRPPDATKPGQVSQVRIIGLRVVDDFGLPMADVLWVRDISAEQVALDRAAAKAKEAAEENARLRDIFDVVPVPVWLRDGDLRIIRANRAFTKACQDEDPGDETTVLRELGTGQTGRELRTLASAARASGTSRSHQFHLVLGGVRQLALVTETPVMVMTPEGTEERYTVGIAQDITELETARTAMEREATSHADVLERLRTAIAIFGPDTRLTFHNTAFARLWRLDSEQLRQDPPEYAELLELWRSRRMLPEVADYPAFRQKELSRFTSLLNPIEDLQHLPDGKTLRRVLTPHPMGGLLATYEDVTDRLALEASLSQGAAVQRETIDHLHEGVAVFGADGRLRLHNPAFVRLLGLDSVDLSGEPHIAEIAVMAETAGLSRQPWEDLRVQLTAAPHDRSIRHARITHSKSIVLDTVGAPLPDGGILFTCFDATDAARVEGRLREKAAVLAEADRLKGAFVAGLAREVRIPLATAQGFAEVLVGGYYGDLNVRQRDCAKGLAAAIESMSELIGGLADLMALETSPPRPIRQAIDVHSLLASALTHIHDQVEEKKLVLHFDCPPDIGVMMGDKKQLEDVLRHLLANAILFTPSGGQITLLGQREGSTVVFAVADTGRGMSEEERAHAFDAFYHGTDGGSGLGLALAQKLVQRHGGAIELISVPNEGTTAIVRLPASPPSVRSPSTSKRHVS